MSDVVQKLTEVLQKLQSYDLVLKKIQKETDESVRAEKLGALIDTINTIDGTSDEKTAD